MAEQPTIKTSNRKFEHDHSCLEPGEYICIKNGKEFVGKQPISRKNYDRSNRQLEV